MELNVGQILAIIWIALNTLIFAPYASYQTYIFHQNKTKSSFIFNRKPDMVISFCCSCIFTLAFVMPLCYGWEIFSNKKLQTEHYGYIVILYSIAATFIIAFWRAWHVWFEAQYKMEAATNTWAKHLDNSEAQLFAKYKNTFGNSKWTKKYLIFIAILLTCVFAVAIWREAFVVIEGIVCCTLFVTFIGLLFLIKRLSSVKDAIMLRLEYIYFASFGCLFGVAYGILYVISHDWGEPDPNNIEILYDALYLILPSPILYCLILIQTQWVLYQYKKLLMMQQTNKNRDGDISSSNKNGKKHNELQVSLKDIMSDFEGYKAFMEYLVKCVSAENLLYVSEVIQFMRDLTKKYQVKATSVQLQTYFDQYIIPKILPKSSIMTTIEATSIRFLRLCEKYILEQSEFEINISHKNRKNIITLYRLLENKINEMNPKINKLANIFGDDSQLLASRRASQTKYRHSNNSNSNHDIDINNNNNNMNGMDIRNDAIEFNLNDNNNNNDDDDGDDAKEQELETTKKKKKRKGHHVQTSSNKISHSCIQDFTLLSNTDDMIQKIYDYLCYTLGDVYTNLNDGCIRFMQTDVYWRWYNNSYKKEKVLKEEEEEEEEEEEDEDEDKNKNKDKHKRSDDSTIKLKISPHSEQTNISHDVSNPTTPDVDDEEQEMRPMKGSSST